MPSRLITTAHYNLFRQRKISWLHFQIAPNDVSRNAKSANNSSTSSNITYISSCICLVTPWRYYHSIFHNHTSESITEKNIHHTRNLQVSPQIWCKNKLLLIHPQAFLLTVLKLKQTSHQPNETDCTSQPKGCRFKSWAAGSDAPILHRFFMATLGYIMIIVHNFSLITYTM